MENKGIYEGVRYDISPAACNVLRADGRDNGLSYGNDHESVLKVRKRIDTINEVDSRLSLDKKLKYRIVKRPEGRTFVVRTQDEDWRQTVLSTSQLEELGINKDAARKACELMGRRAVKYCRSIANDGYAEALTPGLVVASYKIGIKHSPRDPTSIAASYAVSLIELHSRTPCEFQGPHLEEDRLEDIVEEELVGVE